ncbi:MAG: thioredoxin domain-containing protein [Myxococcota bacterium]
MARLRFPASPWPAAAFVVATAVGGCNPSAGRDTAAALPSASVTPKTSAAEADALTRGDEALRARMQSAVADKGAAYVPRTRHLNPDGSAKYTNRLIFEQSPYLLQHAHNPVNWFPWGDEAFAAATRLGRPVFLSVGYSTCHWCHVMEEESFEDEEVAAFLNANYVAIKVDREERPDVDAVYMRSVQLLTRRGGWPMSVWLTPDRQPFFAGTYFPARDGDRGAATGFLTLLRRQNDAYVTRPDQVLDDARRLAAAVAKGLRPPPPADGWPSADILREAAARAAERYDPEWGGSRGRPKFPSSFPIRALLRHARRSGDARSREMALTTLERMASGGMYDHVGGGFHRYSVDERWLVPHFEKMLYDNALLAVAYLEGHQSATGDRARALARTARETLDYVLRDMTASTGGFFSATDADSVGPDGQREEGYYFTWTLAELEAALDPDELTAVRVHYAVTDAGNFEGRNILHTPRPRGEVAAALGVDTTTLDARLTRARAKLLAARGRRPSPLRDDKHITAWNGLMIAALARGGRVLGEPRYTEAAARAARFVASSLRRDGALHRSRRHDLSPTLAFAEDHAFYAWGLLELTQATGEPQWLDPALASLDALDRAYRSPSGAFFRTTERHEALLARQVEQYDGAIPAASSVALLAELMAHTFTTDDRWRRRAERTVRGLAGVLTARPSALEEMLLGIDFHDDVAKEVLIAVPPGGDPAPLLAVAQSQFAPNTMFIVQSGDTPDPASVQRIPWLEGKRPRADAPTAYVCELGACALPTSDPDVFARQLGRIVPYAAPRASP